MKKIVIIGLAVIVAVVLSLLFWQHHKVAREQDFSRKLAGVWSWKYANILETYNFAADGSLTTQDTFTYSKSTNTYQESGTWHIKDGRLTDTITSDTHKRARVPRSSTSQIVRLDANRLIVSIGTNTMELDKIEP
jgi:uncharacterized protein YxeA